MNARRFTVILGLSAGCALFAYVGLASGIASLGYALDDRTAELADLRERENDLVIELANVQSPTTLEEYAALLDLVEMGQISGYIDTRARNLGLGEAGLVSGQ